MLTGEQIKNIKEQLFSHINKTFPEDKKNLVIEQINSMNAEELESFLKQNKIISDGEEKEGCIFCSIVSGETPSHLIGENEDAVAVLEINPISKAHAIIIPKSHDSDLKEKGIEKLTEEIFRKIKSKFKPKEIKIIPSELMGHKIMNVLSVYDNEDMKSKRNKISSKELEELKKSFKEKKPKKGKKVQKKKAEPEEKTKKEIEEKIFLPRRIP